MYNSVFYLTICTFTFIPNVYTFDSIHDLKNPNVTLLNANFFTNDGIENLPDQHCHKLPTTFKDITFSCVSNYPTEWKFTNAPHKDPYIKDIKIVKRRTFTNFSDTSTYNFESNLTLRFKDPSHIQNITCRGAKKLGLQSKNTTVIVKPGYACHIELCIASEIDTEVIFINRSREGYNNGCNIQLEVDEKNKKFNCKYTDEFRESQPSKSLPSLLTRLITCTTPDECHAIFKSDFEICNDTTVVWNCSHDQCKSLNPSMEPGVIVCSNGSTSVARRYFVTNSLGLEENLTLHFERSWNITDVQWSSISSKEENVYAGKSFSLECKATSWRFSYGFVWLIKSPKGEPYIQYGEEKIDESEFAYINTMEFETNETGDYEISCVGPAWNTFEWVNSTINITVKVPEEPYNITLSARVELDGNTTLECRALGDPPPSYEWHLKTPTGLLKFRPDQENPYYKVLQENDTSCSKIVILPSHEVKWKEFICNASNVFGHLKLSQVVKEKNPRLLYRIVFGVLSGLVLIGFAFACVIIRKQRKRLKELSDDDILEFHHGNPESSNAMLLPYNVAYEISPEKIFIEGIVLGEGQFAQVITGKVESENVAIKTLKPSADVLYFKALLSELKILCYVGQHPNIVNLVGACTKNIRKKEVLIIMEYCANGSMLKMLRKSREKFIDRFDEVDDEKIARRSVINYENGSVKYLTTRDLARWACDIASGMEFLREKNVIHGDLAARNILISLNMKAKVGDFGLAKQLFEYSIYIQKLNCPLPLKWMALESLQDLEFSLDSDIWSYGVTIWEIFSLGQTPYPGISQWDFESHKLLKSGYRMEKPDFANHAIYNMMLQCWNNNPKERPSFEYLRLSIQDEMQHF